MLFICPWYVNPYPSGIANFLFVCFKEILCEIQSCIYFGQPSWSKWISSLQIYREYLYWKRIKEKVSSCTEPHDPYWVIAQENKNPRMWGSLCNIDSFKFISVHEKNVF